MKIWFRRLFRRAPVRTLSSLDAYMKWAATYPPQAHNALMRAEQDAMLALMPSLRGQVVLDLASGTGRYGLLAWEASATMSLAIDNSRPMLRANPLPRRLQATSEALPLANACVDVVICALALGHLPALESSLNEIARVLRPNGVALISDVHPFIPLNGGQRTFTAEGRLFAVEHHTHLYSDYHEAAARAGLRIERVAEPRLEAQAMPVVIVFRLVKQVG